MSQVDTQTGEVLDQGQEPEPAQVHKPGAMLAELLNKKIGSISAVSTKHLEAAKLLKLVGAQVSRVPKLLNCTRESILQCVMTLAELGLAPGPLGGAHLIPYKDVCQLVIDYRGLVTLARRSGTISSVQAEVVREGDEWSLSYSIKGAEFRHVPKGGEGKITGAWCLVRFRNNDHQFCYMTRADIDHIRSKSRASGNGPWVTDFAEMAKKSTVRRVCKLLPLTPEIESQIATADRTEFDLAGIDAVEGAGTEDDGTPKTAKLAEELKGQTAAAAAALEARRAEIARQADLAKANGATPDPLAGTTPTNAPSPAAPDPGEVAALDAALGTSDANPSLLPGVRGSRKR